MSCIASTSLTSQQRRASHASSDSPAFTPCSSAQTGSASPPSPTCSHCLHRARRAEGEHGGRSGVTWCRATPTFPRNDARRVERTSARDEVCLLSVGRRRASRSTISPNSALEHCEGRGLRTRRRTRLSLYRSCRRDGSHISLAPAPVPQRCERTTFPSFVT